MNLIVVESPTKANTLKKFLSKEYIIIPSYGHVADLPKSPLSVDLENSYTPQYVLSKQGKKSMSAIKKAAKEADAIYLAPDPDREGEAIAYSIWYRLNKKQEGISKRITFHEITKEAVIEALKKPGKINMNLVEAQQARRVLDRLVGYKLSPLLWKKIRYGLSAGRVQSVAVRLIVERQEQITSFKPEEYWTIKADFSHSEVAEKLTAQLNQFPSVFLKEPVNSQKLPKNKEEAGKIVNAIKEAPSWYIDSVEERTQNRQPYPPFKTSTLQQTAAAVYSWSAKKAMVVAQKLYEQGFITYMRTDSTNLSLSFLTAAQEFLNKQGLGLPQPRFFTKKSIAAQEAHEAIRPTVVDRIPSESGIKDQDQAKLYKLIWERSLACQAKVAEIKQKTVTIIDEAANFKFRISGSEIINKGWLNIVSVGNNTNTTEPVIPTGLKKGDSVKLLGIGPEQHFTNPPAHFNEASLIKELESLGIGRPSTYSVIIDTIIQRLYVERDGKKLIPTDSGVVVTRFLKQYFPQIVDFGFTAQMEEDLDRVAEGAANWVKLIDTFYKPFEKELIEKEKKVQKEDLVVLEKLDKLCPDCGSNLLVKLGKYGRFISCSNYPQCKYAETINKETELENIDFSQLTDPCPECGKNLELKNGPYGKFIGCSNYPKCKFTKPYLNKIGKKCPKCKKGDIIVKIGKFKRMFYGCSRYPECDYITNIKAKVE